MQASAIITSQWSDSKHEERSEFMLHLLYIHPDLPDLVFAGLSSAVP